MSAKTQSAIEALDTAYMLEKMISELLTDGKRLEIILYTDSKSVLEADNTTNLLVDRRLRVDTASLREMNEREEMDQQQKQNCRRADQERTFNNAALQSFLEVSAALEKWILCVCM